MNYDLTEVKSRININQLINKLGGDCPDKDDHHTLCQFHNEKSPSFHIFEKAQRFHCFGCAETGDVFDFYKLVEGCDNVTAYQAVAEMAGVAPEKSHTLRPPKSSTRRPTGGGSLENRVSVNMGDLAAAKADACERLEFDIPNGLKSMMRRKNWRSSTIKKMATDGSLGLNSQGKLLYVYPNGIKIRKDYGSSRGDRWLMGGAKDNLWRGGALEHDLIDNVFITEGESDLITLMQARPEGLQDSYIGLPGSSTKIDPLMAHKIGFDRNVYLLLDNDQAGHECEFRIREALKQEAIGCYVYTIDWDSLCRKSGKLLNDLGDIPEELMKELDTFLMGV